MLLGAFNQQKASSGALSLIIKSPWTFVWSSNILTAHLDPVPEVPEPEPEHPAVAVLEALVRRNHSVQEPGRQCQGGHGREEPGVPQLSLLHIKPSSTFSYELWSLADLLNNGLLLPARVTGKVQPEISQISDYVQITHLIRYHEVWLGLPTIFRHVNIKLMSSLLSFSEP